MRYVLYHSNCYDGFGAAFAAWKKFGDEGTKYIAVSYGYPPPDMPDATEIYIVDFSYPKEKILELAAIAPLTVLDHHKTAQAELEPLIRTDHNGPPEVFNPTIVFDMDRSGALITWQYLHPGVKVPLLIQHISDRDLWTFKMPGSKEIHAALVSLPFDFKVWDNLDTEKLIVEGAACLRFQSQLVDNVVKKSWTGKVGDHDHVAIVNTASSWSEVGHELLQKYPSAPFAASFTVFENIVMWSLRSEDERVDVSAVAKKFGGGGHRNAAGFTTVRF